MDVINLDLERFITLLHTALSDPTGSQTNPKDSFDRCKPNLKNGELSKSECRVESFDGKLVRGAENSGESRQNRHEFFRCRMPFVSCNLLSWLGLM